MHERTATKIALTFIFLLLFGAYYSRAQVEVGSGGIVVLGGCGGTGTPCAINQGGTGASTAPAALANLGGWQVPIFVATPPSGACSTNNQIYYLTTSVPYLEYICQGGTIVQTGGAGSASFSAITNGINTTAAMLVGSGASLGVTGGGTIAATSVNHSLTLTNALASPTSQTFNGSAAITQNLIDPSQTGAQTMQGPLFFNQRRVISTNSVAIRLPCKSFTECTGESFGTASTQRAGFDVCLL